MTFSVIVGISLASAVAFVALQWALGWLHRSKQSRSLRANFLAYQRTPEVRGRLLETRGADVIPLMAPTTRECPVCGVSHDVHPAIVDDRCLECAERQFEAEAAEAPIDPPIDASMFATKAHVLRPFVPRFEEHEYDPEYDADWMKPKKRREPKGAA